MQCFKRNGVKAPEAWAPLPCECDTCGRAILLLADQPQVYCAACPGWCPARPIPASGPPSHPKTKTNYNAAVVGKIVKPR